jgi:hypothetical protein
MPERVKDIKKYTVSEDEVYNYLVNDKGVSKNHAQGMLANIKAESGFNIMAIGDNGSSGGLFQHHADRYSKLKNHVKGDLSNWKGQVDFALSEGATKKYLSKSFDSPEQASTWFTINWERPSDAQNKANKRVSDYFGGGQRKYASTSSESSEQDLKYMPTGYSSTNIMEGFTNNSNPDSTAFLDKTKEDFKKDLEVEKEKEKLIEENPELKALHDKQEFISKALIGDDKLVEYEEAPIQQQGFDMGKVQFADIQTQLPEIG